MDKKDKKTSATTAKGDESKGYPNIEALIEKENFEALNKSFSEAYQKLEGIFNDRAAGIKKQKEARLAMKAYELTTDLIKYLLRIKQDLLKNKPAGKKGA